MSATVTYKGETLTTATNQTRVLETEGKYLEDDITITDATGAAPSGTKNISITTNGTTTEDVTSYATASITTAVPASAVDSGTKSISTNGTHDVIGYASANVAVPNSYSASDEGKVVSSGALVAQTAHADVTPTTSDQTIDTTTNNSLKVKGDANLVAGNIKKDVEIFGTTGIYEGSGGGGISVDDLATNTAPSGAITLSNSITEIKEYAFAGKPITSIYSPAVTKINQNSLQNTSITDITDANFPVLGVNSRFQILLRINTLKHIKLTGGYIALNSGSYALRDNTALITAEFPNAGKNESNHRGTVMYFMASCNKLELADVGQINNIAAYSFSGDSVLTTLILRSTTLVTLNNVSAFNGTPFRNGGTGGTIYIPKVLYDQLGTGTNDYQSATNWSTVHGYGTITWAKIEGSAYEL